MRFMFGVIARITFEKEFNCIQENVRKFFFRKGRQDFSDFGEIVYGLDNLECRLDSEGIRKVALFFNTIVTPELSNSEIPSEKNDGIILSDSSKLSVEGNFYE